MSENETGSPPLYNAYSARKHPDLRAVTYQVLFDQMPNFFTQVDHKWLQDALSSSVQVDTL